MPVLGTKLKGQEEHGLSLNGNVGLFNSGPVLKDEEMKDGLQHQMLAVREQRQSKAPTTWPSKNK